VLYLNRLVKYSLVATLCWLPLNSAQATECRDAEVFKTFMEKQDYRDALQDLDKCLSEIQQSSAEDMKSFDDLVKQIFSQYKLTIEESYSNFQSVLSTHALKGLEYKLANHFESHPDEDKKLFDKIRNPEEKIYFFHDASRTPLDPRGFALTNKTLLWNNLAEEPQAIAFNDIQHVKLIYERGMSLTGWELQINDQKIRLSQVPDNTIIPMVSAMLYFINANKDNQDQLLTLEVPDREVGILAGGVTLCSSKNLVDPAADSIKNLQTFDECLASYGDDFKLSQTDNDQLTQLTQAVLVSGKSLDEGYANFQAILSTHLFKEFKFQFKDALANNQELFKEARDAADVLYFYFDTSKLTSSGTRGVLLTDKAIMWKNLLGSGISFKSLTGSATRLPFDQITGIALTHERDLTSALNAWKLRLNENKDYTMVLVGLSEDNVEMLANAVTYLINSVVGNKLTLQVSPEAKEVLTKSFLERHPKIKSLTDSVLGVFGSKNAEESKPAETATPATDEAKPAKDEVPATEEAKPAEGAAPATDEAKPAESAAPATDEAKPAETATPTTEEKK